MNTINLSDAIMVACGTPAHPQPAAQMPEHDRGISLWSHFAAAAFPAAVAHAHDGAEARDIAEIAALIADEMSREWAQRYGLESPSNNQTD